MLVHIKVAPTIREADQNIFTRNSSEYLNYGLINQSRDNEISNYGSVGQPAWPGSRS
jgi:hypothetical protein